MFTTLVVNSVGFFFPIFSVCDSSGSARITIRLKPIFVLLALALLASALAPLGSALANDNPQRELPHQQATPFSVLVGSHKFPSSNLAAFPKWTRVLDRHAGAGQDANKPCTPIGPNRCIGGEDWKHFLTFLEGKDKRVQVEEVARYVNQATYIPDRVNYGKNDYWAAPFELFARGGDCEDYAVAKFLALRALGFSNGQLRLVVVQDLRRGLPHAVLVVRLDHQDLVLDNQLSRVVTADQIRHYRPIYSINEEYWWLHLA